MEHTRASLLPPPRLHGLARRRLPPHRHPGYFRHFRACPRAGHGLHNKEAEGVWGGGVVAADADCACAEESVDEGEAVA